MVLSTSYSVCLAWPAPAPGTIAVLVGACLLYPKDRYVLALGHKVPPSYLFCRLLTYPAFRDLNSAIRNVYTLVSLLSV